MAWWVGPGNEAIAMLQQASQYMLHRDPEWRVEGTQSGGRSAPEVVFVQSTCMYCMQGIYAMISAVTMSGLGCYTSLRYLHCAQPPLDIVSKLLDPGLPLKRQFTLLGNGSLPPLQQCFSLAFWKLEGGGRGRGEEGGKRREEGGEGRREE